MASIAPLHNEIHAQVKIDDSNMQHIQDRQILPVVFHEFVRVACEYPIVFVKNSDTGQYQAVCVLGIKPQENKFVKNEKWIGGYLPASSRHAPLCLVPQDNNQSMIIGINETSSRINLESGQTLFNAAGEESDYLKARKEMLVDYFEKEQVSEQITQGLANMGLLVPQEITLKVNGENVVINGIYIIDEERLNSLPETDFLSLRQRGLLPAIYAHLISIHQLERVATFAGN